MGEVLTIGSTNLARMMPETDSRARAIIAEIDSMNLDILCTQETEEWLEKRLAERLRGGWMVISDHVNCPILARADKFQRVEWNGENFITITMPGSVRKRYGSAALLKRNSDGLVFVVGNLHPSNRGESPNSATDRLRQARSAIEHLAKWGVTDFPMAIVGDMNDKSLPSEGLPGVFTGYGFRDVLGELHHALRIDRGFVKRFVPVSFRVNSVVPSVSDHDFVIFEVRMPDVIPIDEQPETELEKLIRDHGQIEQFKVESFNKARKAHTASRYVAVMQDWLDLEITCIWSEADQTAYDDWRKRTFPTWPPADYKGPAGMTSVAALAKVAASRGKTIYPVVP